MRPDDRDIDAVDNCWYHYKFQVIPWLFGWWLHAGVKLVMRCICIMFNQIPQVVLEGRMREEQQLIKVGGVARRGIRVLSVVL